MKAAPVGQQLAITVWILLQGYTSWIHFDLASTTLKIVFLVQIFKIPFLIRLKKALILVKNAPAFTSVFNFIVLQV